MLPQLDHCCCGCSLQTGSILIGAYQLVRGIFEMSFDLFLDLSGTATGGKGWAFRFVEAVLGLLKMIAALVLIFGANKERHRLIYWVLIVDVALVIIDGAVFSLSVPILFMYGTITEAVIILLLGIVDFALELYFLWVVFSYYRIIEERAPTTALSA